MQLGVVSQNHTLPSPCTAFSQAFSVTSLRRRIRGVRARNGLTYRSDDVTRNELAEKE